MRNIIELSPLGHTWFIDIDGTICKHNGYKIDGYDTLLPGVIEFFNNIPESDLIILVTSRTDEYKDNTIKFLNESHIRYDQILFNAPYGERIVINDNKPSGLEMSKAININRDDDNKLSIIINKDL